MADILKIWIDKEPNPCQFYRARVHKAARCYRYLPLCARCSARYSAILAPSGCSCRARIALSSSADSSPAALTASCVSPRSSARLKIPPPSLPAPDALLSRTVQPLSLSVPLWLRMPPRSQPPLWSTDGAGAARVDDAGAIRYALAARRRPYGFGRSPFGNCCKIFARALSSSVGKSAGVKLVPSAPRKSVGMSSVSTSNLSV